MPFFKYVIHTSRNEWNLNKSVRGKEFDSDAFANQRLVNTMRHLSQLIQIADDVFETIEIECRSIFERTQNLHTKLQIVQNIVDQLNAKTVPIPIGSLATSQIISKHFRCDIERLNNTSIFFSFQRPSLVKKFQEKVSTYIVQRSPPLVNIHCGMVALNEQFLTDSSSNSTVLINSEQLRVEETILSLNQMNDVDTQNKNMPSEKTPSSIVEIDVSGQRFSRLSSFRRSLIHVDLLIRRKKKKDKRRNTLTEGDVKGFKDVLQNIVNEDFQLKLPYFTSHKTIAESNNCYNSKIHNSEQIEKYSVEHNNNANEVKCQKPTSIDKIILDEKGKQDSLLQKEHLDKNLTGLENLKQVNRKKPRSLIPISTTSAAMNVAVEMRQHNTNENNIPISNEIKNSNLVSDKLKESRRISNSSLCSDDSASQENWKTYKKRLQDKCRSLKGKTSPVENCIIKNTNISNSTSTESINHSDKTITIDTCLETDTFFISSDESDAELKDTEKCEFSMSIGMNSDGSLNSLLSETGNELIASNGSLASVGCSKGNENLLNHPSPSSITFSITKNENIIKSLQSSNDIDSPMKTKQNECKSKNTMKGEISKKCKKNSNLVLSQIQDKDENSKSLFTNFGLKSKTKGKTKLKKESNKKKTSSIVYQPAFDMYGQYSPKNIKHITSFMEENSLPILQNEEKKGMESFVIKPTRKACIQERVINNEKINKNDESFNIGSEHKISSMKNAVQSAENEIPLKYAHQVIVTPLQRPCEIQNMQNSKQQSVNESYLLKHNKIVQSESINTESSSIPRLAKSNTLSSNQHESSKLAARVVLDFDGKIIYSSNSLDRKNCITNSNVNKFDSTKHTLSQAPLKSFLSYKNHCILSKEPSPQNCESDYNSKDILFTNNQTHNQNCKVNLSQNKNNSYKEESYPCKQIFFSEDLSNAQHLNSCTPKSLQASIRKCRTSRPNSFAGYSLSTVFQNQSNNLLPDPNILGIPTTETEVRENNEYLYSNYAKFTNINSETQNSKLTSNSYHSSSLHDLNCEKGLNHSPQSTMSTDDLFAVIHSYKKRMNIKTNCDVSPSSSLSRSNSPSFSRQCSSKSVLAETGFLSPRNQSYIERSGDRRSWADFRPVDSICSHRKSLASDRLGPSKPTSMHDFKMLLLQAKSNKTPGQRKSAVEMLKVTQQQSTQNFKASPIESSPQNFMSYSAPTSPSDIHLFSGHSTVPLKRGNRTRTSLQSRYIIYPPIFEDCLEDSEKLQ